MFRRIVACLSALLCTCAAAAQQTAFPFCSKVQLAYKQPPRGVPPPPAAIRDGKLVDRNSGKAIALKGINWFGFNVGTSMVDGLWAGGTEAATDFALIVYQFKLLGFNAVRIPFRWTDLDAKPARQDKVCSAVSVDWLRKRLIHPKLVDKFNGAQLPGNVAPLKNDRGGMCNTYVPTTTVHERLVWVTQVFISQGFYVVLDYQPMGTELQAYNVQTFVSRWEALWRMVACAPNFSTDMRNRVFVDPMNEPDSMEIRWEPAGNKPGARQLYLGLADRLWQLTPNGVLFMFEGTGQNMFGLNWGNGFVVDMRIIRERGISDPNPFFKQLLTRPYNTSAVMTPHIYPPSILKSVYLGKALWEQSEIAFGYLATKGYCAGGFCRKFPIVIGETGCAFDNKVDMQWLTDFAEFVNSRGEASAYNKQRIESWLWWCLNENSHDTGGLVKNGWQDLDWQKLSYLISQLGLRPWYMRVGGGQ